MKHRLTTTLPVLALFLVVSLAFAQDSALEGVDIQSDKVAPAGIYDFATHGTAWVAETPTALKLFKHVAFGTQVQAKAAGTQWVHIPVPFPARIADTLVNIQYVEFCARSTNGAVTRPIRMDLWARNGGRFSWTNIAWPADNVQHCVGKVLNPAEWHEDLGVSLLLQFGNAKDKIILDKAWVRVAP